MNSLSWVKGTVGSSEAKSASALHLDAIKPGKHRAFGRVDIIGNQAGNLLSCECTGNRLLGSGSRETFGLSHEMGKRAVTACEHVSSLQVARDIEE